MSMMRTHALPNCCATSGSAISSTAATAKATSRLSSVIMGVSSGAVGDALAEQALRAQGQHQDQHDEREDVLVVAAEHAAGQHADVAGAEGLDQAEQHAADHRTGEVA